MMSDDDDAAPQVSAVEDYYLVDSSKQPVCFSTLPLQDGDTDDVPEGKKRLVLWGIADRIEKVYREVVAWRLVLEGKQPEIAVLAADGGGWIRLLKPKKSYEEEIRRVLITAQMLHFLRRKPDDPEKNLWRHLRKIFDKFDVRPSEDDLRSHHSLMKHFAEKDPVLAKSEVLQVFIEGRSRKNISEVGADNIEIKQPFIADDEDIDEMIIEDANNESDEEEDEDLFDSICAICDNGGDILCCDGPCMRSFHAKKGSGEDSYCDTLGYSEAQIEAMKIFLCKNCEHKQHQCFICGVLEPSDGAAAKVFLCNNATCGHFYHPKCVAKQLHPNNRNEATELEKKIPEGFSFTCPIHWCFHCKGVEDRTQEPLQFAVCRRCPKSYHRMCLPREISFQDIEEEDIITRAWELSKRILIYCLDHEIDSEIDTPVRDHIRFPKTEEPAQFLKKRLLHKKKKRTFSEAVRDQPLKDSREMMACVQKTEQTKQICRQVSMKSCTENLVVKPEKKKAKFIKEKIHPESHVPKDASVSSPKSVKEQEQELVVLPSSAARKIPLSSFPTVDSEAEKRVLSVLGNRVSKLTLKDVTRKCSVPSTHVYSGRQTDKIALGKIERSVQAVGAALKKLETGDNVNDAKAVCEPDVLKQLSKWHSKFRVYISPFIHGTRYSSFGRHFTKEEKLVEIVDKLHWYVEPGDTIVDFCCGSNDFSWLMKEKLGEVQKKCYFKNYDLIQPKNHFCFEKRDWMTVKPNELPHGSQLIMGLNPPFGVKASLANKFIEKALSFKPKLVVLIVPKETKRLDQKKTPYDLIWEDSECLSGKAFYLPGSVDLNDKTVEGWNASAPPLYLWSRPDWTKKHMKIAEEHCHTSIGKIACHVEEENLLDDLLVRKQAEATNKWNSRSGKERKTDRTACNDTEANLPVDHAAKKQARSEERGITEKVAARVKEANMSDKLPVRKQTDPTSKAILGKEKENERYESRSDNRRKCTPDHVESLPPEKQVEVAYEERKFTIPRKESHHEHRGSCHENRRSSLGKETKSSRHNYEQIAVGMPNIKSMDGGDSDMIISSPDSSNARSKSRSYSPAMPTQVPYDRIVHADSYCPPKELCDPLLNRATYKGSCLPSNDEYFDALKYSDIDNSSRMRGASIDEVTKPYISGPTSMYGLQSRDDDSLYRHLSSDDLNTTFGRSLVPDVARQGHSIRYDDQTGGNCQVSRIPLTSGSQTHLSMHGGTGTNYLSARHSLGSSGPIFSQPASTTPSFGLSGACLQGGSIMHKYAYGLSGPSGPQSSIMDKYAPSLDGTFNIRPESSLPQQYPLRRPGYGGGWPQN
ncbi:hypothetical protein HU200_028883 [Digitaria exilis]|uniref:Zinc finger PHD-type domain-containing protein n=1 Tax=Digitaria exilis TaxID=1010633 RepID=A0A835BRA3_9POAL|nr:hypothetical protein HU200_028883 [Digitaria exilis]